MNGPVLKDWCIGWPPLAINYKLPFTMHKICVRGILYDNPKDKKGRVVILEGITFLDAEKRTLKTSKMVFFLGDPDPKFASWLEKMKIGLSEYNIDL